MALKFKKKLLFAKKETTYGTDAVPAEANAILAENVTITPLQTVTEERQQAGNIGANEIIVVGQTSMIEFDVELYGSGTVDVAAAWALLMRMCAHSEAITASTDVQYDPIDDSEESTTLYFDLHGQKHPMLGGRGSMSFNIKSPGRMMAHFKLAFLWGAPVTAASLVPDYSAWKAPVPVNNANTTFTLDGFAAKLIELTLDQNNETPYRNLVGAEEIAVADHAWSGSVTIEAPIISTKDYFDVCKQASIAALAFAHGQTAGNIVLIDSTRVQLSNPQYGDGDGFATLSMDLTLPPSTAGLDEIKITTK